MPDMSHMSLLNCVGYVSAWIAWVKLLRGVRGLHGSKYFLRGSTSCVGCVVGQNILRGSKIFA